MFSFCAWKCILSSPLCLKICVVNTLKSTKLQHPLLEACFNIPTISLFHLFKHLSKQMINMSCSGNFHNSLLMSAIVTVLKFSCVWAANTVSSVLCLTYSKFPHLSSFYIIAMTKSTQYYTCMDFLANGLLNQGRIIITI